MCCCSNNNNYYSIPYSMTPYNYNCYFTPNHCCNSGSTFGLGGMNSLCLIALFALLCR